MKRFLLMRKGGLLVWGLIGAVLLLMVGSSMLFARTAVVRHERDVSRMVFNDNVELLEQVRKSSGALDDSLASVQSPAGGKGAASRTVGMLGTILEFAKKRRVVKENVARGIERALANPDELADERRRVAQEVVGEVDGRAAERVVDVVVDCVGSAS